jgi:hypothetical protein
MWKRALRLSATLILGWSPSLAAGDMRALTGIVTDKRGKALPGSAVQIENSITLTVRSYITGKDGRYYFNYLNGDIDYTVKAKYRNYWSGAKTLSKFNESNHPEVNLEIPID